MIRKTRNKGGDILPQRQSNLELLRIISILLIIAHHYMVSSGVTGLFGSDSSLRPNELMMFACAAWGKMAINCFILISGYFLCTARLTWLRYIKLLATVFFYDICIFIVGNIGGIIEATPVSILKLCFGLMSSVNNGFIASFFVFYLFVPCYNVIIKNTSRKQLRNIIFGLLIVICVSSSFFFSNAMNEPVWYMTMYLLAAYFRLYPNKYTSSKSFSLVLLIISVVVSFFSFIFFHKYGGAIAGGLKLRNDVGTIFWLGDSCRIMSLVVGVSAFLFAKNVKPFYNKLINEMALGCFGVLLLHTNSFTRGWMWQYIFHVNYFFTQPLYILFFHIVGCTLCIFTIGAVVDFLRRRYIESAFMRWLGRYDVLKNEILS